MAMRRMFGNHYALPQIDNGRRTTMSDKAIRVVEWAREQFHATEPIVQHAGSFVFLVLLVGFPVALIVGADQ
jgi:hypothetical protein